MNSDDNDNNMPHWPSPPASSGSGCSPSGSFSSAQGRSSWWSVIIINREGGRWEPCGILPVVRLNVLLVVDGAHVHVVRCDDHLLEGKVIVVVGVRMIIFIAIMIMILSLYLVAAEFWPEGFLNRSLRSLCCRSQPGFNVMIVVMIIMIVLTIIITMIIIMTLLQKTHFLPIKRIRLPHTSPFHRPLKDARNHSWK